MSEEKIICGNCGNEMEASANFCPSCGQQAKNDLTIGVLFYNTISNYFSFDARFFKTFLPLLFKPGFLAQTFIEGKRLRYLHPAQTYLFVTVIFFFLISFIQSRQVKELEEKKIEYLKKKVAGTDEKMTNEDTDTTMLLNQENWEVTKDSSGRINIQGYEPAELQEKLQEEIDAEDLSFDFSGVRFGGHNLDSLIALGISDEEILKLMGLKENDNFFVKRFYQQTLNSIKYGRGGSFLNQLYSSVPVAMFFLLPIFALFLQLFFRKKGEYVHHLVFSLYFFAFVFSIFSLILIFNFIGDLPNWMDAILNFLVFLYLIVGLKRFYGYGLRQSILRGSSVTVLFMILVIPITLGLLSLFAFMMY